MNNLSEKIDKVSVIIPVYNEELYVQEVLQQLQKVRLPSPLQMEIIIVDDGSTDRTSEILKLQDGSDLLKIRFQERNFGKGAAIREGLKHVTGQIVVIQDADLEYSIDDYPRLLAPLLEGRAEVVYGSRFLGHISGMKWANRIFNYLIRWTTNILFHAKITDEATAYKVLKTKTLRALELKSNRFEICPEITAKVLKRGIPIYEVPVTYHARTHRQGKKIHASDALSALYTLLKYWALPPQK
jgi:glycosyltransferase involved in cell wall biosynthesis